jgi:AraC-like DNA-binding protein
MDVSAMPFEQHGCGIHALRSGTGGTGGLSRAAFARSFQRALGQAPMQFLAGWRTTLARDYPRTGQPTLAQVADRTGYASPDAFDDGHERLALTQI